MFDTLADLRDRHQGQTAFLLGSGPSMASCDLSLLAQATTFCTNLFPVHIPVEQLNPSYYCAYDPGYVQPSPHPPWLAALHARPQLVKFLPASWRHLGLDLAARWIRLNDAPLEKAARFSWDPAHGFLDGATVMLNLCLPLAFWMGFRRIVLLGCECSYAGASPYFYPASQHVPGRFHDSTAGTSWTHRVLAGFALVDAEASRLGVEILNATPGGVLEQFPKVSLEKAL